MSKIVVALSGGLDSTTVAYKLKSEGHDVYGAYLDFGKAVTEQEVKSVKLISLSLGIPVEIIDVSGLGAIQGCFTSIGNSRGDDELDIGLRTSPVMKSVRVGRPDDLYISGFHSVLSVTSYFAQIINYDGIAIGAIKAQFEHIKGLSEVIIAFEKVVTGLNPNAGEFSIVAPLQDLSKEDVVKLANQLKLPIEMTWSCVFAGDEPCGECRQCKSRIKALND